MAEIEEPRFTSLQARIAALNQSQAGSQHQTFGKRPPPPIPTSSNPLGLAARSQTINNPPVPTYGSPATKQANNQPVGVKPVKAGLLPPPPVDRDNTQRTAAKTPPLPARKAPPPLPARQASQPTPTLPPRKTSTQLTRRGSNSSTLSFSSTVSGKSLGQTASSTTSASSFDTQRKLPPSFDQATLPVLPPSRRDLEEETKPSPAARLPIISVKSAPDVLRDIPSADRDAPPKMPPRPSAPPKLPTRPVGGNRNEESAQAQPSPQRRLPPPALNRPSILSMGFNNKKKDTPSPARSPTPEPSRPAQPAREYSQPAPPGSENSHLSGPAVRELTEHDFDSVVMTGTPALVDFYAPYCGYCKELDPIWQELGESFASSPGITIAKVDVNEYKSFMERFEDIQGYPTILYFDGNNEMPEKYLYQRKLPALTDYVEKKSKISPHAKPTTPVPPAINLRSRPTASQMSAVKSRPAPEASSTSGCLICRDFSGPDRLAAKYPRSSLPQHGDVSTYLASVLCDPFPSHTDKARAIFTWLHHNVAYDTVAFFGNNVKHVSPNDTARKGLAVCSGYAGLFHSIATKAGLESMEINGHGMGAGLKPLGANAPVPAFNMNHAWNAVRFDSGEWKLIDTCWGAGAVEGQSYRKGFNPRWFTTSNEDFGQQHFPTEERHFFAASPRTWKEYMCGPTDGEPLQIFGSPDSDHGVATKSFQPAQKGIHVSQGGGEDVVRFQFSRVCEHWDPVRNGKGKPFLLILVFNGAGGKKKELVPLETNAFWYWLDVKKKDLGVKGQNVHCYSVKSLDGKDGRGLTVAEFREKNGKVGMAFDFVATWDLV